METLEPFIGFYSDIGLDHKSPIYSVSIVEIKMHVNIDFSFQMWIIKIQRKKGQFPRYFHWLSAKNFIN